jgi:hypothetical protein
MGRLMLIALASLTMLNPALAQSPRDASEGIKVGDWWTYNQKDEITGTVRDTYTSTVTEISPKEIITSLSFRGRSNLGVVIFDHDWNRIVNGALRSNPNDGHGVRLPLEVGKEWRLEFEERNTQSGAGFKGTSASKVVAQEPMTTAAGTYDTFKIERQFKEFNAADPSRLTEVQFVLWFAPQINHWVRRTTLTKVQKRTISNTSDELIELGRKQ